MNTGCRSSHRPQPRKPQPTLLQALMLIVVGAHETLARGNGDLDQPDGIDKSVLVIATPRRYRNREHLRYVAQQACLICGRKPSDPHHLRYLQPRALGRKASDEFAVPLCRSIIARSIASATSGPGGRRPASTRSRSPASSGGKPGSMIRTILTSRVSRRARRLDRSPRHLTVRGNRDPIRLVIGRADDGRTP